MSPRKRAPREDSLDEDLDEVGNEEGLQATEDDGLESVHETTRKAYEALQSVTPEDEDGTDTTTKDEETIGDEGAKRVDKADNSQEEKPQKDGKALKTKGKKGKEDVEEDETIYPPQRFKLPSKELFNKLPKELKQELKQTIADLESKFHESQREAKTAVEESREVSEVVRPYMKKWGLKGFTPGQAIAQLAAANDYILDKPEEALVWLANERGIDLAKLVARQQGKAPEEQDDPKYKQLTERLNTLENERQETLKQRKEREDAQFDQGVKTVAQQLSEIREEKDRSGRYLFPKLHDEAYLSEATPLIVAMLKTAQGDLRKAVALAYSSMEQRNLSDFLPSVPVKPQPRNNQNVLEQARVASISTRGRPASVMNGTFTDKVGKIPSGVKDTARLAYEMLESGD